MRCLSTRIRSPKDHEGIQTAHSRIPRSAVSSIRSVAGEPSSTQDNRMRRYAIVGSSGHAITLQYQQDKKARIVKQYLHAAWRIFMTKNLPRRGKMPRTEKQNLGDRGEQLVAKVVRCPGCKREERTLRTLPPNFKCADVVCDFCGYLAQVKTKSIKGLLPAICPSPILGAAWAPQKQRMEAGVYFSLFIVIENEDGISSIFFLPRDLQTAEMFVPRKPLSSTARRAGWQGFTIDLAKALAAPVLYEDGDVSQFGKPKRARL